jgi:hypothetical protein
MASWTLAPPKLLLLFRWRLHGLVDDVAVTDGGLALVPLVVLILHRHADADVVAVLEAESVVGVGVGGKPVLAVDLLAIGFELGERLVLAAAGLQRRFRAPTRTAIPTRTPIRRGLH